MFCNCRSPSFSTNLSPSRLPHARFGTIPVAFFFNSNGTGLEIQNGLRW